MCCLLNTSTPKVFALGVEVFVFASLALFVVSGGVGTPLPQISGIVQSGDEAFDSLGVRGNLGVVAVSAFQRVTEMLDEFCECSGGLARDITARLDDGVGLSLASGGGFVSCDGHGVLSSGSGGCSIMQVYNHFLLLSTSGLGKESLGLYLPVTVFTGVDDLGANLTGSVRTDCLIAG